MTGVTSLGEISLNLDSIALSRKKVSNESSKSNIDGNDSNNNLDNSHNDCIDRNQASPYPLLHPHLELDDLDDQYSDITKTMNQNGDTSSGGCKNKELKPRRKHGWVQPSLIRQDCVTESNGL